MVIQIGEAGKAKSTADTGPQLNGGREPITAAHRRAQLALRLTVKEVELADRGSASCVEPVPRTAGQRKRNEFGPCSVILPGKKRETDTE